MKRKRFTEEQIAFALRQHESGATPLSQVALFHGSSQDS